MTDRYDIVIVGAGHGGAHAAIALRQRKYEGTIAIIGEEEHLPYERLPLSKDYLAKKKKFERILIWPKSFWKDRGISMLLGQRVMRVAPLTRSVITANGGVIEYGSLIWAAGGRPRSLNRMAADAPGVHSIRNRDDVDRIIGELDFVRVQTQSAS